MRAARLKRPRAARVQINESGEVSGRKVIEVRNVSHGYGGRALLKDFSLRVMRGDRIGIIGNNGVGKSAFLRILLASSRRTRLGEARREPRGGLLRSVRRELDVTKTVTEIVGEGREYVTIHGHKKHVVAYLTDFFVPAKEP